jgi:hypothetical protein
MPSVYINNTNPKPSQTTLKQSVIARIPLWRDDEINLKKGIEEATQSRHPLWNHCLTCSTKRYKFLHQV